MLHLQLNRMNRVNLFCFVFIGLSHLSLGIQRRYLTQLCPGSVGPTHGEVIRFDPNFNNTQWVIPETDIDCYMTLRGMPGTATGPPWTTTLTWPGNYQFTVRGWDYANTGCDTAFIEIYLASVQGQPTGNPIVPKMCGDTRPGDFTTASQSIVVRLYAEKEPVLPTADPSTVTVGTPTNTTTTTTSTNSSGTASSGNSSIPDTGGPYITFRADFTSYFLDCTSDGTENDEDQLQCLNNRCIDMSLRCDRYGSNNCGDLGDQTVQPPGNCSAVVPPTDPTDDPLLPLYIVLGALAFLAMLYWCCWRPGWCPWRLARLRNTRCCRRVCRPCRTGKLAKCSRNGLCGPAQGCYTRCSKGGCNRTKSGFPERKPDDVDFNSADSMQAWLTFAHDDGMHVREMR